MKQERKGKERIVGKTASAGREGREVGTAVKRKEMKRHDK
jgi:hypothetical protein